MGRMLLGDVVERLRTLPDNSVHAVVTSPPYWALRRYLPDGHQDTDKEIGREKTPDEFIARLVGVFEEVRRVLRPDGVCWVNLGDSYAQSGGRGMNTNAEIIAGNKNTSRRESPSTKLAPQSPPPGYKAKDLVGVPWMFALAMRAAGWYLRSDVIWNKPTAMPSSVRDRPTTAHEYLFMFTKSAHYFYDSLNGSEAVTGGAHPRGKGINPKSKGGRASGVKANDDFARATNDMVEMRNFRTVWTFGSESYKGRHFATYPSTIVHRCLGVSLSVHGVCPVCKTPWRRLLAKKRQPTRPGAKSKVGNVSTHDDSPYQGHRGNRDPLRHTTVYKHVAWLSQCGCLVNHRRPELERAVVLDPFMGSGTTAQVAHHMGFDWVGIDIDERNESLLAQRLLLVPKCLRSPVQKSKSLPPVEGQGKLFDV